LAEIEYFSSVVVEPVCLIVCKSRGWSE
jgi:hypothetical protein